MASTKIAATVSPADDLALALGDVPVMTRAEGLKIVEADAGLLRDYERLSATRDKTVKAGINYYHDLGATALRLDKDGKRGPYAVVALAAALGCNRATINKAHRFYLRYPSDEARNQLCERRNKAGNLLTFSHIYAALDVDDHKKFYGLIETAYKQSLSVRDMQQLVKGATADTPSRGRLTPRGITGGLSSLGSIGKAVHHHFIDVLPKVVVGPLAKLIDKPEQIDARTLKEVKQAKETLKSVHTEASERLKDFDELELRLEEVLRVKAEQEAAAEEARQAAEKAEQPEELHEEEAEAGAAEAHKGNGKAKGGKAGKRQRRPVPA